MDDKRARDILFKAHWQSGWKITRPSPDDFAYAKAQGFMFDPVRLTHDQAVANLIAVRAEARGDVLAEAFLASLGTRRMDWRSPLGSFAFARNFPDHRLASKRPSDAGTAPYCCPCCGIVIGGFSDENDLSVLSFEKHKWGGVRRDDVVYAWFDLWTARDLSDVRARDVDREMFKAILATARSLPEKASVSDLAKALKGVFPSSESERRVVVEILAICGILRPAARPGYLNGFTPWEARTVPSHYKNDWAYPAIWWKGRDGVDAAAVAQYFPGID